MSRVTNQQILNHIMNLNHDLNGLRQEMREGFEVNRQEHLEMKQDVAAVSSVVMSNRKKIHKLLRIRS